MTLQIKATKVNDDIKSSFNGDTPLVDIKTNQADPLVNLVTTLLAGSIRVEDKLKFLQSGLYPEDVEGQYLTLVAQMMGATRNIDEPSKVAVIVMGKAGAIVPANTLLLDYAGNEWKTLTDAIVQDKYGYTNACSVTAGAFDLENGELKLKTNIDNIERVTNSAQPILGGKIETDEALRNRLLSRRSQWRAKGTAGGLEWAIAQLNGVLKSRVITDLPDCFNIKCNSPAFEIKRYMIAVLGGLDADIAKTIFENLCIGTERLAGSTSVNYRCDTIKFQRMCPVIVDVRYWFKCDCVLPQSSANIKQTIADALNKTSLTQSTWSVQDLCKINKDLIKIEFKPRKMVLMPDNCPCPITYDNPITGETNQNYCTNDPNSHCLIEPDCGTNWADCLILQKWWYPIFLTQYINEGTGCPCPAPDKGCGCALGG